MSRPNTVPWTQLFPELRGNTEVSMICDSTLRKNGDRHYRVKIKLPHSQLAEAQRKLSPYGFVVTAWGFPERRYMVPVYGAEALKCIRHETGPRRG